MIKNNRLYYKYIYLNKNHIKNENYNNDLKNNIINEKINSFDNNNNLLKNNDILKIIILQKIKKILMIFINMIISNKKILLIIEIIFIKLFLLKMKLYQFVKIYIYHQNMQVLILAKKS